MIIEFIAKITQQLMNIFIPEILFFIFVKKTAKKFKFRFSSIESYPNLKPFANTWIVGLVALLISLFALPIYELVFGKLISVWLLSLGILKLLILTMSLISFTLIFLVNYLFEKNYDNISYLLMGVSAICFMIFLYIHFTYI